MSGLSLREVGIAIFVGCIELEENVNRAFCGGGVELSFSYPFGALLTAEAVDRVYPDFCYSVWVVFGDFFYFDSALRREHAEMFTL